MWGTSGGGSVCKAREGCNFSWGFGYMRQGGRRDVTTWNPSIPVRTEAIGASTSSKHLRAFSRYPQHPTQHAGWELPAGEKGKMEGCGVENAAKCRGAPICTR